MESRRFAGSLRTGRWIALALTVSAASSCHEVDQIVDHFRDMTPHEAYVESLWLAGLTESALVQDWIRLSDDALQRAVPVVNPYEEEGFIRPGEPAAMGYRVELERGQRLAVEIDVRSEESARVFVDLFRAYDGEGDEPIPLVSMDSTEHSLVFEASRSGPYIIRMQPELLRGGQYRVSLRWGASFAFPVEGRTTSAILSFFGADREGGRRSHHGVDIFAPRGTPVVSATSGVVSRVEVTNLGGKVVWVRDNVRNSNIYYAHLDSQLVAGGTRVEPGDTLGLVGNSGNAITTPPHLHFGVYARRQGPVDPWYFLFEPEGEFEVRTAPLEAVGDWVRVAEDGIRLRDAPSTRAPVSEQLPRYTPVRVAAVAGSWYRIEMPDGRAGFVAARLTESVEEPVAISGVSPSGTDLRTHPLPDAPIMARIAVTDEIPVLGVFNDYLYVRSPDGSHGWIPAQVDTQLP